MGQRKRKRMKTRTASSFLKEFLSERRAEVVEDKEVSEGRGRIASFVKRPIEEVIEEYVDLSTTGNKNRLQGLCPFHNDHNPSMDVSLDKQRFICWACGAKGDVIDFVREHDHISWHAAVEIACTDIVYETEDGEPGSPAVRELEKRMLAAARETHGTEEGKAAIREARKLLSRQGIDAALKYWDNRLFKT